MRSVYDFLGPAIFDVIIEDYLTVVGRPLQRLQAKRLARRGKIRSALFDPENPRVLPTRLLFGAAKVWERRIKLFDADLWVQGVEGPIVHGPARERSDGDLIFRPRTLIYTRFARIGDRQVDGVGVAGGACADAAGIPREHGVTLFRYPHSIRHVRSHGSRQIRTLRRSVRACATSAVCPPIALHAGPPSQALRCSGP